MPIKVKGETYYDEDDLNRTVLQLERDLGNMPSGTPEHASLAKHIDDLKDAARSEVADTPASEPEHTEDSPVTAPGDSTDSDAGEFTHDLQEAAEKGLPILCPTCGQEVPFPESPPMNPHATQCDECNGWGKVVNPTRVDGWIWQTCGKCGGNGFTTDTPGYGPQSIRHAAVAPQLAGAVWSEGAQRWLPPADAQEPPWAGATWDGLGGKWS